MKTLDFLRSNFKLELWDEDRKNVAIFILTRAGLTLPGMIIRART